MRLSLRTLTPLLCAAALPAAAQQQPPVRALGAVTSSASEVFGDVAGVRHLPGGRVLVNDPVGRRVLLMDSTLKIVSIVADSTSSTANAYGSRRGGLIAYRGDSTLFVDPAGLSMLMIDPSGKIARVMSVPRSQDAALMVAPTGTPAFDATGRLVYRGFPAFTFAPPSSNGTFTPPVMPDSTPLVRIDLATRKLDTVSFIKVPAPKMNMTKTDDGGVRMTSEFNPLPVTDDWAVTSEGKVALIRGRDYHIDWVGSNGALSTSPKIPYAWERLTDEQKVAFIDSVKAARQRLVASGQAANSISMGGGAQMTINSTTRSAPGAGTERTVVAGAGQQMILGGGPNAAGGLSSQINFVAPSELPDYKPAFFGGAARPDRDGNIWIRVLPTTGAPAGGPLYDVVNSTGELVDRVQIPKDRSIIGFGEGGVVYLTTRDAQGVHLERARTR